MEPAGLEVPDLAVSSGAVGEQLELLPALARPAVIPATSVFPAGTSTEDPVGRILVDLPVAHLGREFEYAVPATMAADARPGVRVKVRFAGKDRDGFIVARTSDVEHNGRLNSIRRVVSSVPVLSPQILDLCRSLSVKYAGTVMDLIRLALPPRHAATEKKWLDRLENPVAPVDSPAPSYETALWTPYQGGEAFLGRLHAGASPWAVWTALPARRKGVPLTAGGWAEAFVDAACATLASGRRSLLVAPDQRDLAHLEIALRNRAFIAVTDPDQAVESAGKFARLTAEDAPSIRYGSFLGALSGEADIVIGTRSAAFAPIANLGLIACWDDGDDLYAEPRTPYVHIREVLIERAQHESSALCLGSYTRSTPAQLLLATAAAQSVIADRATIRSTTARVSWFDDIDQDREGPGGAARLPGGAIRLIREGLESGPVLVQVPRRGYLPGIACATCRAMASCTNCHGPLSLGGAAGFPRCQWCGQLEPNFHCPECEGTTLRSIRTGSVRTAEELGRAFPSARVVSSTAYGDGRVISHIPAEPALVVATPGAEPAVTDGTYSVAVLLDAAILTSRVSMRAGEEALRRWLHAAALVRSVTAGGKVLLVGDGDQRPIQALVRWDPAGFAERELSERQTLHLPPAVGCASITGPTHALRQLLGHAKLPEHTEILGPVPAPPTTTRRTENRNPDTTENGPNQTESMLEGHPDEELSRTILRCPLTSQDDLAAALQQAQGVRAARKEPGTIRIEVNPQELL